MISMVPNFQNRISKSHKNEKTHLGIARVLKQTVYVHTLGSDQVTGQSQPPQSFDI